MDSAPEEGASKEIKENKVVHQTDMEGEDVVPNQDVDTVSKEYLISDKVINSEESFTKDNCFEETDDEADNEEETNKFLTLMSKAERRNQKKLERKQKMFPTKTTNWRDVTLDDPNDDTSDTEDEDDTMETRKFLYMLQNAKKKNTPQPKNNMVNVKWKSGRVEISNIPHTLKVTRVPAGEEAIRLQQEELARRREEVRRMDRSHQERGQVGGKRKFEDRMTLTEAKLTDFQDSKDYVDFIQSKLQGVNIKIVK